VWSADGFYKAFSLARQQPTPQAYILNVLLRCCLELGMAALQAMPVILSMIAMDFCEKCSL